jgi:hypothetical protein
LEAQYAVASGTPSRPACEVVHTIAPPPARRIAGTPWRTHRNVPTRLTSSVRRKVSGDRSSIRATVRIPAFAIVGLEAVAGQLAGQPVHGVRVQISRDDGRALLAEPARGGGADAARRPRDQTSPSLHTCSWQHRS